MAEEVKFQLGADTSKLDRALDNAIRDAAKLDAEMKQVDKSIKAAGGTVKVNIDADKSAVDSAAADIKAIDGATPKITLEVDNSRLADALDLVKNIGLAAGAIVIGGAAAGVGILANDNQATNAAVRQFAAATGQTEQEATAIGAVIDEVWVSGFAESKAQIGGIAAQLYQSGVEIEDIGQTATDALIIAAATGKDVNDIIQAQITLVNTGLAPSYAAAGELLSTGFANGLNKADDLLDTIKEYSRDFSDLGLTGEDFFNILNSGLEGGAYNTDKIADAFRELKIRVGTALSTGAGTEFDGLQSLGLLDEAKAYEAGEITGRQWVQAVLDVTDASNLDAIVTGTFGSPIEDLGVTVFESIDAALGDPRLQLTFANTTQIMADNLENNLGFALNRAKNTVVTDLANSFEIAGKPLTDLLDSLPERLNKFSDLVQSGRGLPEALEIALEAPGLSDSIRQLQANLGGFIVELQLSIAGFLEGIGQGGAAAGLRASGVAGAQSQLAFDLQYLDPDQAAASIATALRRGVDESGVNAAIVEAGENLISDDKLKQFQVILDQLENSAFLPTTITAGSTVSGSQLYQIDPAELDSVKTTIAEAVSQIDGWRTTVAFGEVIGFDTEALLEDAGVIETLGIRTAEADDALISYSDAAVLAADKTALLGDRATTFEDAGASAFEGFSTRSIAALDAVNRAMDVTQQKMFDTGVNPAAFAAMVFGGTIDASNYQVNQTFNTGSQSQSSSAGAQAARRIRGY